MRAFKDILVGVAFEPDGKTPTQGGRMVVAHATRLALACSSKVTLLHVPDLEEPDQDCEEIARRLDSLLVDLRAQGLRVERVVGSPDRPWVALIRRAAAEGHDLVMISKRNDAHAETPRFGVNAIKLVRKCPVPVWVVHPDRDEIVRRVLSAADFSPVGARVMELGGAVARALKAEFHVVHAWQMSLEMQLELGRASSEESDRLVAQHGDEIRARLEAELEALGAPAHELHVGRTSPVRGIEQCLAHCSPDLLVMGTLSRTGIPGLLIGNTAERLLERIDTALLTVKPEGFVSPVLES